MLVPKGSIHGIIGENGAGKSTLMNILYGFYQADSGSILVDGELQKIRTPEDAIKAGIGMVHQHFMLVEPFTVLENLLLGAEGGFTLDAGIEKARQEIIALERDYGLEVDLDAKIEDLPVGVQQRVEILKALFRGARILILDEPTGVLTPQEADDLFPHSRESEGPGSDRGPDHPQASRDHGGDRQCLDHAPGPDGGPSKDGGDLDRGTGRADGRAEGPPRVSTKGRRVPAPDVLSVRDLSVRDQAGVQRVKGVSFDVRAGRDRRHRRCCRQWPVLPARSADRHRGRSRAAASASPAKAKFQRLRPHGRPERLGHVPEDRLRMGLIRGFPCP